LVEVQALHGEGLVAFVCTVAKPSPKSKTALANLNGTDLLSKDAAGFQSAGLTPSQARDLVAALALWISESENIL